MPRYLAVSAVQREGTPVGTWTASAGGATPPDHPAVPEGSCLVAVVNNGAWQSALDVTYPGYYARLRRRWEEGVWQAMSLYLVDEERAAKIEDGRRALMDGTPVRDPGRALR
jgi:hypothetical protein